MSKFAKLASFASLGLVIIPSLLYFAGSLELDAMKWAILVGTACWFIAATLWMSH